jgi:hypothetical protein
MIQFDVIQGLNKYFSCSKCISFPRVERMMENNGTRSRSTDPLASIHASLVFLITKPWSTEIGAWTQRKLILFPLIPYASRLSYTKSRLLLLARIHFKPAFRYARQRSLPSPFATLSTCSCSKVIRTDLYVYPEVMPWEKINETQ